MPLGDGAPLGWGRGGAHARVPPSTNELSDLAFWGRAHQVKDGALLWAAGVLGSTPGRDGSCLCSPPAEAARLSLSSPVPAGLPSCRHSTETWRVFARERVCAHAFIRGGWVSRDGQVGLRDYHRQRWWGFLFPLSSGDTSVTEVSLRCSATICGVGGQPVSRPRSSCKSQCDPFIL